MENSDKVLYNLVASEDACPQCGERDQDSLEWDENGEAILCDCGCHYIPPAANTTRNQIVADACRRTALKLMNLVDAGHVSMMVDANTLHEVLHSLANEIEGAMADLTFQQLVDRGGFSTSRTLEAVSVTGIKGRLRRERAVDRNTGREYQGPEVRYWTLDEAQRIWTYLRDRDYDSLPDDGK